MANTKLSNVYGLDKMIKNVPAKIDKYTEEVHEEVEDAKSKSLYYSEMNAVGMITCIVLLAIGAGISFVPNLFFEYLKISNSLIDTSNIVIKVGGIFLLLVSIHGISRMIFDSKARATAKNVNKMGDSFKNEFESVALPKIAGNQLINKIENFEDDEISEVSSLDDKLFNSISSMQSRDKLFSKLVLISRIALPVILFVAVLLVIFKGKDLGFARVTIAFIIMFIFNSRLCLLLEYKVGALIRSAMCIPSVIYGVLIYISIKEEAQGLNFLPYNTLIKLPEAVLNYVGTATFICLIQVTVLILSIAFRDYYSEKNHWRDGVSINGKEEKHKKWYIIYGIILYVILMCAYAFVLIVDKDEIQYSSSIGSAILIGAIFGVIWRIVSPIWPEAISKTIRKFWGVRYTVVVELFFVALILTELLLTGFVFSLYSVILLVSIIIFSWIAFAVLQHFWG